MFWTNTLDLNRAHKRNHDDRRTPEDSRHQPDPSVAGLSDLRRSATAGLAFSSPAGLLIARITATQVGVSHLHSVGLSVEVLGQSPIKAGDIRFEALVLRVTDIEDAAPREP
jgi:hypothetical protein